MIDRKKTIQIVAATRSSEVEFRERSALGISLRRFAFDPRLRADISCLNTLPLPTIYNRCIEQSEQVDYMVFMHDDVWLDDHFFVDRVIEACESYDIVGVAGCKHRVDRQPAWAFKNDRLEWHSPDNLSGAVSHGQQPFYGVLSYFGPAPADCALLDGVLLAARRDAIIRTGLRFDPTFDFHFYDLDFCRAAEARGLRMGTWPIAITHQSGGLFGSPGWHARKVSYLSKWKV